MPIEITARAFAGIGKPLNVFVCVESKLNIASRIAPHTGIIEGININNIAFMLSEFISIGPFNDMDSLRRRYIIIPGATPKLTMSARLSSSFPIAEYALSNLADKPSRKSNIIAASISHEAVTRFPLAAKIIAINPDARLSDVIKFGKCFMLKLDNVIKKGSKIKINFSIHVN
jgi:hypothetical protein